MAARDSPDPEFRDGIGQIIMGGDRLRFYASAMLPYEHLERATHGLRAQLRLQLLHADVHQMPAWETFEVTGPKHVTDARGQTWFEYRATIESRGPFEGDGDLADEQQDPAR